MGSAHCLQPSRKATSASVKPKRSRLPGCLQHQAPGLWILPSAPSAPCRAPVLCGAPQCILGQDDTRAREAAPDAARVARRCSQGMGQYLTPQNLSEKRSACPGQLSTRRISTELADALTSYYSTATCPYECFGTSPCLGTRAGPAAGAP